MNTPEQHAGTRRRFLRESGRFLALGGLVSFVLGQEFKGRRLANDPDCIRLNTCRDCIEFNGCNKPKAEQFRASTTPPLRTQ